ncbi:hypothetical protein DVR11_05005 [Paracoccus versutus]|nr:hypothetical protein DVR11_05005 [Paracoccus versutus]
MGNSGKAGKPGIPMCGRIDVNGQPEADRARAGLEMMRQRCRARRGDPEAALHILNHIVPDIPADEEDQS